MKMSLTANYGGEASFFSIILSLFPFFCLPLHPVKL